MAYAPCTVGEVSKASRIRSASLYTIAALLSVGIVALVLELWRANLSLPFIHKGDAAFACACVKSIIDNGWYLKNRRLGAPHGMNLCDYPMADNLHFLGIKLLACASSNWAVVLNLYFLLTFPLTTLSALFVFRRFGCGYLASLVGSLLYSFLPFHFLRGEIHLLLASYYLVPLMIMLILEVFLDLPVFSPQGPAIIWRSWIAPSSRLLICLLIASAGVYYAFFGCFLLLVAGCSCWYYKRTLHPLLKSAGLIIILSMATAANLLPSIAYHIQRGPNPQSMARHPFHADVFGLKPVQLLLPVTDHRLALLRELKAEYNTAFQPLVNENDHSSLGMVGGLGFLLMLGRFSYRRSRTLEPGLQDAFAILCLACLFLCTIGGLGSLFSLLVSPMIRGYNRISVYIAFFALFTVVLILDRISSGLKASGARFVFGLLAFGLLVAGIWDQTTRKFVPHYAWVRNDFSSDEKFVRAVEARLPDNALVFQLPYASFPEQGPIHQMIDYDHLRGYLHSNKLRWSYGCMKGRVGDNWAKDISSKPIEEMVGSLVHAGFSGIYIDRAGFQDAGMKLESDLSAILHVQPLVSPNRILTFFNLSLYQHRMGCLYENE
jgi:phosphoglycerol transferase